MNPNTKKEPTQDDRCGTRAGYRAHFRRGENYCEPCRDAEKTRSSQYAKENAERIYINKKIYLKNHPEIRKRIQARRKNALLSNQGDVYTEYQVLITYGALCHICNEVIDLTAPRLTGQTGWQRGLHIDHLIPLAKDGADSIENVRPAHAICNIKKGAVVR